jgi:Ca2+-binding EF-hand superfamily protein
MPPSQKMSALFDRIDTSANGTITKPQLESALSSMKAPMVLKSSGADAIFSQLDTRGTGAISKQQFVQGMTSLISHMRNSSASESQAAPAAPPESPGYTLDGSLQLFNASGGSLDLMA